MERNDIRQLVDLLLDELVEGQKKKLLSDGRRIVPTLTPEDMLQPNDYPELENDPHFRYEEGMLAGLLAAQTACRALMRRTGDASEDCSR